MEPMTVPLASSLQTELARQIVSLALDQGWNSGQRLSELALANELGVSRSPVRAALNALAGHGLVRYEPRRGFVLARLPSDADQIDGVTPPSEIEALYGRIMTDRAAGALPAEVSEAELSDRYGSPRGQVRKVLLRFAADGLARRLRGHGWAFTESLDTPDAVAESYQFRLVIECGALRQPGFRVDPAALATLHAAQKEILNAPAASITRERWFRVNAAYHETIVAWSGNRFLLQAIRQQNNLRRMTEYADFDELSEARIQRACGEHIAILEALAEGDLDYAEALLRRHIERAGRDPAQED
jgi:DNA-binding GntR family transcriptional regulator